jgi:hypothetical protein
MFKYELPLQVNNYLKDRLRGEIACIKGNINSVIT